MADFKDQDKSKTQLIAELVEMRRRVAAAEAAEVETRRTAAELAGSKAILEATIESLPLDFFAIGPDGRYMMQNTTSKLHWGEAIGKRPEDAAGTRRTWRYGGSIIDAPLPVKRSKAKWSSPSMANNGSPTVWLRRIREGGRIAGILGINIDITARKRAEEALRESEERFRKIFEEGPIGMALIGTDGRIRHCNRRFCEMLDYSESEMIALGVEGVSHPADWKRDHPFVFRLRRGEIQRFQAEKRYLRKDGRVIWGQLTASLFRDAAGRPAGTVGMVEDITERKLRRRGGAEGA